jgi:cell wall-associated NlpC family hydrolase
VIRTALAAVLSIALAACAGAPLKGGQGDSGSAAAPAAANPAAAAAAQRSADPRTMMIDLATSMLGQPYRYGGAAPGGFDCSGLVAYAAGGAGIRVPRTAREQLAGGVPVARSDLKAGDLVFMHLAHKELHVGIALDSARFIHAPATGGYVRIDSLAAPPYARGFIKARRIIAAP